ncbi:MAG: LysR family transcriptional regulator [Hyphomonadaceae bacterium JAD_PAG50586_4]|nr:MAG: LysR family transcriptional regulator [Hyphomonadaceae bacterium JAD_PAG50586_4]
MTDTRRVPLDTEYGIKEWDDLRLFLAIVRGGHFQGAARIMKTNQTTVARRFRRMEEMLGAKLLERFGQEFKLTKSGAEIFDRAIAIEQLAQEVNDRVRALDVRPSGTVKLAVTEGLASLWLTARLAEFCKRYPEISLELIPSHGEYDLLTSGADVAIGWRRPMEPRLVGSRIGSVGFILFASEDYVREFGAFENVADVERHWFLQYDTHEVQRWNTSLMQEARGLERIKLRTSSIFIYLSAVRAGMGIGHLPTFYQHRYSDLVEMPVELADRGELWLVSHEETNGFKRTRMLLDFLRADFKANGGQLFRQSP